MEDLFEEECDQLQVSCSNGNQWGVVEDAYGCLVPYCLDGYCKLDAGLCVMFGIVYCSVSETKDGRLGGGGENNAFRIKMSLYH